MLTAAISADKKNLEAGYDLPELSKYLDHIHVMAYDYHGTWNNKVLPNAPMRGSYGIGVVMILNEKLNQNKYCSSNEIKV